MSETKEQLYIGLTIGPIFPTLEKIKSTRALFCGSYIFSWLMRELIQEITANGIKPEQVLTPSTKVPHGKPEAGYYADRLIIAAQPDDFGKLLAAQEAVLSKMAAAMENEPSIRKPATDIKAYLERYFMLYSFEHERSEKGDPFKAINSILNGLELHKRFPDVDEDWLVHFLNQKQPNFLIKDAFTKARFKSIIEITTGELEQFDPAGYKEIIRQEIAQPQRGDDARLSDAEGDEAILQKFQAKSSAFGEHLRSYHKYIAVVHADGDGIGKYTGKLDNEGFKRFSDQLFAFSQEAKDKIVAYGGAPIFIGGDDLLFLAPVASQGASSGQAHLRTVFHLIQDLDALFQEERYFPKGPDSPTFSYGISFTYYKFPLNEARALSYEMEEAAKDGAKNAVAFQLRKHSGAFFEAKLSKAHPEFDHFVDLVGAFALEQNFLSTLIHRLGFHRGTLEMLLKLGSNAEERLAYFFENNFDEAIHDKERMFFKRVIAFLRELYLANPVDAFDKLNAALRFIHFLRSTEDEE